MILKVGDKYKTDLHSIFDEEYIYEIRSINNESITYQIVDNNISSPNRRLSPEAFRKYFTHVPHYDTKIYKVLNGN